MSGVRPEPDCHPKKVAGFDRIGRILPDLIQVANRKVVLVIFTKEQKSELRYGIYIR